MDPAALANIAVEALAAARARSGLVLLRVHPDDLTAINAARPALAARIAAAVELRAIADPAVGRGGCVVETPAGRLDARLETQLAALEQAVFGPGTGTGTGAGTGPGAGTGAGPGIGTGTGTGAGEQGGHG
jgi:flagellar biosynthesis/type III secretory pathway protein FliH